MLDDDITDNLDKTEQPTPKRLFEAKEKGIVAKSSELLTAGVMLAGMIVFFFFLFPISHLIFNLSTLIFSNLNYDYSSVETVTSWTEHGLWQMATVLFIPFVAIFILAIIVNVLQTGFIFSTHPIRFRWSNLNIFNKQNYKRIFTVQLFYKLFLGGFKFIFVLFLCWKFISSDSVGIYKAAGKNPEGLLVFLFDKTILLGTMIAIIYFFLGLLDFAYQKWLFLLEMKMSRREVREELKQMEGNKFAKMKLQSMVQKLALNRLIVTMPKADVLITSREGIAIALRYDAKKMGAPQCVAMGAYRKGITMRELATQYRVPIVENRMLAENLFKKMREGEILPIDFFHEVAKILTNLK